MSEASVLKSDLTGLFAEYGRALTVRRMASNEDGVYDPTTGVVTPVSGAPAYTDYPGIGRIGDYADRLVDGAMITTKDRLATFIPDDAGFVPEANDRLIAGADVYTVIRFKTRELGGTAIVYSLQVRR